MAILLADGTKILDTKGRNFTDSEIDFRGAKFTGEVTGNRFNDVDFTGADFSGAKLDLSIFNNTKLTNTVWDGASAVNTEFRGARGSNASFKNVDFGADPSVGGRGRTIFMAHFSDSDFSGSDFEGARMDSGALHNSNFNSTNLKNTSWGAEGSTTGSTFQGADLTDAWFHSTWHPADDTDLELRNLWIYLNHLGTYSRVNSIVQVIGLNEKQPHSFRDWSCINIC